MKLPIYFKIKNRPYYSIWLTIKYCLTQWMFGSLTEADWYEIMKIAGEEDNPNLRFDRLLESIRNLRRE